MIPEFRYNDGGRSEIYKGEARDCVVRAIAIAAQLPYKDVYSDLYIFTGCSPRNGVSKKASRAFITEVLGWKWVPTMKFGQGCTVHLHPDELPKGRLIVSLSKHYTTMIDGVINDTYDPCRYRSVPDVGQDLKLGEWRNSSGVHSVSRCVYGYYIQKDIPNTLNKIKEQ